MKWCLAFLVLLLPLPAGAYQVKVQGHQVSVKAQPDTHSSPIAVLSNQKVPLLRVLRTATGELWAFIQLPKNQKGWLPSRFLDPILEHNIPLRIQETPAALLMEYALFSLESIRRKPVDNKTELVWRKSTLLLKIAFIKEAWETKKARLDFLDLAKRIGIQIKASEYQGLEQELQTLEKQFTQTVTSYQLVA